MKLHGAIRMQVKPFQAQRIIQAHVCGFIPMSSRMARSAGQAGWPTRPTRNELKETADQDMKEKAMRKLSMYNDLEARFKVKIKENNSLKDKIQRLEFCRFIWHVGLGSWQEQMK